MQGQKFCRMLQGEHSAILSTFIKLPFVIKTFILSIFEWPFNTGFTVDKNKMALLQEGTVSRFGSVTFSIIRPVLTHESVDVLKMSRYTRLSFDSYQG